jgi:hypothetical protein
VEAIEAACVVIVTVALAIAAASKIARPAATRAALDALGVPPGLSRWGAFAVPAIELTVAAAFAVRPAWAVAQALVVGLFAVFGAAGVWALARGRKIECACFGALARKSTLGMTQVLRLGAVLGLVVVLRTSPPTWEPTTGAAGFAGSLVAASALMLAAGARAWRRTRADRQSLAHTRLLTRELALATEESHA